MMRIVRDMPIRRKLLLVILLASSLAMLAVAAAVVLYELTTFQPRILRDLSANAAILRINMHAPLNFDDHKAATENLATLSVISEISAACVYAADGSVFAQHVRLPRGDFSFPAAPERAGHRFEADRLILSERIEHDGELVGYLYLQQDFPPLAARLAQYGIMAGLVVLALVVVSILLSRGLERTISRPLLELSRTTRHVTEQKDYRLRAARYGEDEIGQLTEAFNQMLSTIETHQNALKRSEDELRDLLNMSPNIFYIYDLVERRNLFINRSVLEVLGYTPEQMGSMGSFVLTEVLHQDDVPRVADHHGQFATAADGDVLDIDYRMRHRDGRWRWLHSRDGIYRRDPDGKARSIVGSALDITERKLVEEQIRRINEELERRVQERTAQLELANRELEAFSYSVSHDLRAPLRSLDGFARILLDRYASELPEKAQHYLGLVRGSAQRMAKLIDELLAFSRMGRQTLQTRPVSIAELVRQTLEELRAEHEERAVEIVLGELPDCQADPALLKQVWVNLLSNALKFTRNRDVARIEIGSKARDNETVYFVKDNGVGFDMQYSHKLFGIFQRLHRFEDYEGTGVGLAIAQRIVHRHGGRVWAEAELERGATFSFTLHRTGEKA